MAGAIDPLGERKNALDAFLETKVAEGFRVETHTDTHAIIIVGGHRTPLWIPQAGRRQPLRGIGRRARRGDDDPRRAEAKLDSTPAGGHDLLPRRSRVRTAAWRSCRPARTPAVATRRGARRGRPLGVTGPVTTVTPSRAQREPGPVDRIATCRAPSPGTLNEAHRPEERGALRLTHRLGFSPESGRRTSRNLRQAGRPGLESSSPLLGAATREVRSTAIRLPMPPCARACRRGARPRGRPDRERRHAAARFRRDAETSFRASAPCRGGNPSFRQAHGCLAGHGPDRVFGS
jgi:hypothetical protein